MSLIDEWSEPCVLVDKTQVSDGEGGFTTAWIEGAEFMAAIVLDTSNEAIIAEKQGMTKTYRVTTPKNMILSFHNVFKRVSDGETFRVTSDGKDVQTPERATFQFSQVAAEKYALPIDGGTT